MENLIIISTISYSLYLLYLAMTRKNCVQKDVRNNMEKYRKEMLNWGNK